MIQFQLTSLLFVLGCALENPYCLFGSVGDSCFGKCETGYHIIQVGSAYVCEPCNNQCLECEQGQYEQEQSCFPCQQGCHQCVTKVACSCQYPCLYCNKLGCNQCEKEYNLMQGICVSNQIRSLAAGTIPSYQLYQSQLLIQSISNCILPITLQIKERLFRCINFGSPNANSCELSVQCTTQTLLQCEPGQYLFGALTFSQNEITIEPTYDNQITCKICGTYCGSSTIDYCHFSTCNTCPVGCYCNLGYCIFCNAGYYMNDTTELCELCPNPCTICTSQSVCTQCVTKYYLQGSSCVKCDETCQLCTNSRCKSCGIAKYPLISYGQLSCYPCNANCNTCTQKQCTLCSPAYYLDKTGVCQICTKSCLTCSDSTTCTTCFDPLTTIQSNCLCTRKQFQQLDLTCVDCKYPCTQCKSKTYCTQCAGLIGLQLYNFTCICSSNSYQLTDGSCQLCLSQCETCNSQGCLTCQAIQSRTLQNNKCVCQQGFIDIQEDICLDCNSLQGQITQQCQYSNCSDGYWTQGEECDDGNNNIRDGCSNCQIDRQYYCINTILQPSLCYQCSVNCLACDSSGCLTCVNQYKLVNSQCLVLCPDNCKLCKSPNKCDKCIELYEINNFNQCIIYQNSNVADNMPLNSTYRLGGAGFNNSIEGSATLLDQNSKYNNLSIQLNSEFSYQFQSLTIDNFDNQNYSFQYNLTNNRLNLDFTFLSSIDKQNLIEITLIKQTQNRRLLQTTNSSGYLALKVIPNPQPVYSADQLQQIQQVQSVQTGLTSTLTFVGPATILFGGFNMFMNILQVISWVSNLYYINVHYPGNIETFFQYMSLSSIFSIPSIVSFNQPSDDYFKQSPSRFMDQNQDPLFINNMQQIIVVTMVLLALKPILILYFICTSSKGNKRSLKVNFNQFKMDLAINHAFSRVSNDSDSAIRNYIHGKLTNFNKYYSSYLIQNINVNLLDICLAISLQLIYQLNIQYPIVAVNVALSILSGIILMISLYQIYLSSTKHIMLLEQESYIISYDSIYEGVNLQKQLAKKYGIVNIIRKILFIVCLVGFYDIPILQSIICSILYSISTLMLIYENPFQDKISYLKYGVPDVFMALAISLTIVFAIDDQLLWLSMNSRFQVGWVILGTIFASIIIQIGIIFQEFLKNIQESLKWVFSRLKTPRS